MRRLILSIHDVTPAHSRRIGELEALLADTCGRDAAWAMLVVPEFHGEHHIGRDRGFQAWLRARAATGVEMLLHGWSHRDDAPASWRARHMTASEGEFCGLTEAAARQRLRDGRALLEDILGQPVRAFVAPAWLYSPGARAALAAEGFAITEDHFSVWSPSSGAVLSRDPVISYASRSRGRIRSSLLWSRIATTVLQPFRTARLALHPHDTDAPELLTEARRAIAALARGRALARYDSLVA